MKCLIYFGMSSMKEGTSAQLSGRGELHGGARVTTLVTLRKCTLGNKREIKTLKFVLASTKGFKGGLAWIKPSKKDMAVTFSYLLGTDFFVQHSQIQSLTLQAPYLLYVDHGSGRESVPLEQSEHTSSYLRLSKEEPSNMMAASKTEDYQLLGEVLVQGLKELGYCREHLSVELFASDKQHVLDLYCSKGKNCSYKFY